MATETVNINPEENNPSLEEQAALQDEAQSSSGDEKILGKFDTYEDLEKAYAELQSNFTKSRQSPESESDADSGEEASEEVAREAVEQAGLDFEALSQEFWNNEGLTDESYAKLAESGIPRDLVDSYIEGQQALLNSTTTQVYDSVGGQENYQAMTEWASDNLSDDQVDAFNRAVNSGDMGETMFAVQGLKSMYDAQRGVEPQRQLAGQARASTESYGSLAQMKADMADPRYQTDPAFREAVAQKLGRSNIM